jgi:GT2 family glycosyltransferase
MPLVAVVIVNWNGKRALLRCLDSVYRLDYAPLDVIVVDNGSADGSCDVVEEEYPQTILLPLDKNYGAIVGRNRGLKEGIERGAAYLLTLDNDQVIHRDFVQRGVAIAEADPRIAMVGGLIYCLSRPQVIESAGGIVDYSQNVGRNRASMQEDRGQFTHDESISWLGTGGLLSKKTALDVIGFCDESFVGYGLEDTEWGVRARAKGFDVVFSPSLKTWHEGHSDLGGYSFLRKYCWAYNAILFMKRHARWHHWVKFSVFGGLGLLYALVVQGVKGNIGGVIGKARGYYDAMTGNRERALRILHSARPRRPPSST